MNLLDLCERVRQVYELIERIYPGLQDRAVRPPCTARMGLLGDEAPAQTNARTGLLMGGAGHSKRYPPLY